MCVCIIVNHNCPMYHAVCSCRPGWWERGALESVYAFHQSDLMRLIWSHVYTHTHTLNDNMPHGNLISLGSPAPRNGASSLNGISELFSKCHPETKPLCMQLWEDLWLNQAWIISVVCIIKSALVSWSSYCKEVVTHRGSHVLLTHSFISLYILYIGYIGLTIWLYFTWG